MKKHSIAVIPGDGIGPEVIDEAVHVLGRVAEKSGAFSFDFDFFPWGCAYYLEHGIMMPQDGIAQLERYDAILLGAVGDPRVPDHISLWQLLLRIRKEMDQYVNLRPIRLLHGAPCPLKDMVPERVICSLSGRTARANMPEAARGCFGEPPGKWSSKTAYSPGRAASG